MANNTRNFNLFLLSFSESRRSKVVFYVSIDVYVMFYAGVLVLETGSFTQLASQSTLCKGSTLPRLFVVGRKTLLVTAGHATTQNLDGKKLCWVGGVA